MRIEKTFRNEAIASCLILLILSLIPRFYKLDFQSFWMDEGLSAWLGTTSVEHIIKFKMKDFNPPLYDILVLLYFKIFGLSIYLLRATSAIFGALLAPILFLFCFYNFNRSAGWITASLVIFNQKLIIYSQEARPYSLLMLIGFIYFTIGWQIFRHGSEKKTHSYAFILSGAMLLYLHYSAIYFFVACSITWCATIFIHQKKQAILLFKNSFIILLLFSPWLPIVYSDSKKMVALDSYAFTKCWRAYFKILE